MPSLRAISEPHSKLTPSTDLLGCIVSWRAQQRPEERDRNYFMVGGVPCRMSEVEEL